MPWQAPQFTEIDMNAEIGAYQRDPLNDRADRQRSPQPGAEARGRTPAPEPRHDAASRLR